MNDFLPQGTTIPNTSKYMKFDKIDNQFRVVSHAVVGFEYFNAEGKPSRSKEQPVGIPDDIGTDKTGKQNEISYFWAFVVIDRADSKIRILEVKQKSVMGSMQSLIQNKAWGNPNGYDIVVSKTGTGFETRYTTQPLPPTPLTDMEKKLIESTPVNLEALFTGADPFNTQVEEKWKEVEAPKEVKGDYDFDIEDVSINDVKF